VKLTVRPSVPEDRVALQESAFDAVGNYEGHQESRERPTTKNHNRMEGRETWETSDGQGGLSVG
jgi:hypothetical protein